MTTYTRVKVQASNGPELQNIAMAAFRREKKVPFCLESTSAGNSKLAHAYSNYKHAYLLYDDKKLVGMLYGNSFREAGVDCIELSVIKMEDFDSDAVINEYAQTLPANVKVCK